MLAGLACGVGAGAVWGLVFLAPALAVDFTPLELTIGRYACYGLIAAALLAPRWRPLAGRIPRRQWWNLAWLALAGNTLYISGRGGVDPATMKVPDDPVAEAKLMLDSYKAILEKAGMTMDNLVTVTVYCPDLTLYQKFNEVYRTYFGKDLPARAFVGSGPLLFGMRFEMQGIAVK